MSIEQRKAVKPRSTRYTEEQEQVFSQLEELGFNVSNLLRKAAEIVINDTQYIVNHNKIK